ncbi:ribosome hibernation-promoting factor, HPF/YfiA family [Propylenella binzhouense]|uniref:Ribosome-associated translation inhibitor RaiA n=1 Tax=Propylenella binzhouense TaxID=2555902 RepID=A0A964T3P9_9HYPH|nr:ribosome-associated translation inhibitor RaiA [Propylenella binzhouense]MYZ47739.1 ribosome-associated translation inhibitor RaiA [Propylenella binzhouense]
MPQQVDTPITVGSSSIDLGSAIREHAEQEIRKVADKYFQRLNTASVHFTNEGNAFRCSVNIRMGGLDMMSAEAAAKDAYLAFDSALAKVEKQLRRTKREIREDKHG